MKKTQVKGDKGGKYSKLWKFVEEQVKIAERRGKTSVDTEDLWKKYEKRGSDKTKFTSGAHFHQTLARSLHLTNFDIHTIAKLYSFLEIPVNYEIKGKLKRVAKVKLNKKGCVVKYDKQDESDSEGNEEEVNDNLVLNYILAQIRKGDRVGSAVNLRDPEFWKKFAVDTGSKRDSLSLLYQFGSNLKSTVEKSNLEPEKMLQLYQELRISIDEEFVKKILDSLHKVVSTNQFNVIIDVRNA